MLGLIYLGLGWFIGYSLLKLMTPGLFNLSERRSLFGKEVPLEHWMITLPGGFLIGTMLMTSATYFCYYGFRNSNYPLLWGNIISFVFFGALAVYFIVRSRTALLDLINSIKGISLERIAAFYRRHKLELNLILIILVVWSIFIFRSFYVKDDQAFVGASVYSDFGPHLAVIRSFSLGSNVPTEYPHFPDGKIRYHFFFQFLVGNLEFLGLRLDWAFNLPSILAFAGFLMLLYSLAVLLTGAKTVGIVTLILFFFRSSFAFFTYISGMSSISEILRKIWSNADHIGKTQCENWGLWAQKVFVNQRHFPLAFGILILFIIILLPLLQKMLSGLAKAKNRINDEPDSLKEFLLIESSWVPENIRLSIIMGLVLGVLSYWNGAVVVAAYPIFFIMALMSKQRIAYLNIAVFSMAVILVITGFFSGTGQSVVEPKITIGFLAPVKDLPGIIAYYTEVMGIFPYILGLSLFFLPLGGRWLALAFLTPLILATTLQLTPDIVVNHKYVTLSVILLNILVADFLVRLHQGQLSWASSKKKLYNLNFTSGITMEPELQEAELKPNIYYPVSGWVQLTEASGNLVGAEFKLQLEQEHSLPPDLIAARAEHASSKALAIPRFLGKLLTIVLLALMTITGVVDIITLYNMDKVAYSFRMNDPLTQWAVKNTGPNEIFLSHHYVTHPILLAGRKIFYGWPYFAWSAGYDTSGRETIVKEIYNGRDPERIKQLVKENRLSYIIIDDDIRNSNNYFLDEQIFTNHFKLVYQEPERRISIYKTY